MEGRHEAHPGDDLARQAREQSQQVAEQAKQTGRAMFDERKVAFALQTEHLSEALHQAAGTLRERGDKTLGGYTDWAAESLHHFSRTLSENDTGRLMDRTNDFIRRQPVLFFGGAIAAGLVLSRMLKSSTPAEHTSEEYERAETGAALEEAYAAPSPESASVPPPESPRG